VDSAIVADEFLLFADGRAGKIYQMSLPDGAEVNVVALAAFPVGLDYDPENKLVRPETCFNNKVFYLLKLIYD
jgi:hypothetical protein